MRTLAFDGRTGASGDMLLATLIAIGADPDVLEPVEASLGIEYRVGETVKNGIHATTVDVLFDEEGRDRAASGWSIGESDRYSHEHDEAHEHDHSHSHGDTHDHADDHDHAHSHDHGHGESGDHTHAEGHGPTRSYDECVEIVDEMGIEQSIADDAKAVFTLLGEAESRVHGTDLHRTHFHEVGADDAIADIVGTALLIADLEPDRIVTTPVAVGAGEVSIAHGTYPVPTPAVTYLAETADWVVRGGPIEVELLTPTGAALLAHFATGVDSVPHLQLERSGFGAGTATFEDRPNVLRAMVGTSAGSLLRDDIRLLETNLDDATPEVLGSLQETLTEAGARDVVIVPATMKKSRPGHLVKVVVKPDDVEQVTRRLAEETGTLGVRETSVDHRWIAERSFDTVQLDIDGRTYEVSVKVARDDEGTVYDVSAEYDDAATVADETGRPVREIVRRAESRYDAESS